MAGQGTVGILALQGAWSLHATKCQQLGYRTRPVRDPADLLGLHALILPGGESTTIGALAERRSLLAPLRQAIGAGLPTLGTCAGAILLASRIENTREPWLAAMATSVARNAYGSQIDSFAATLETCGPLAGFSIDALFIRAPRFRDWSDQVEVLARHAGEAVILRQEHCLAATCHPELGQSIIFHQWFLESMTK